MQMALRHPESVQGFHDASENIPESLGDRFQLLVKGILLEIFVYVP
jgi:hypothetical protein